MLVLPIVGDLGLVELGKKGMVWLGVTKGGGFGQKRDGQEDWVFQDNVWPGGVAHLCQS